MKLTWKDFVTTVLAAIGGSVVYAKFYDYNWALIASWRSATMLLALTGIVMAAFSNFDFNNLSILNVSEMVLGVVAVLLAATGAVFVSETMFYSLASVMGAVWLVDTARHLRHSIIGANTTSFHHHAHVH